MKRREEIAVFGVVPPPVTGMSFVVGKMCALLAEHWPVQVLNLSNGRAPNSVRFRVGKFLRFWRALVRMLAWSAHKRLRIYLAPDSGGGLYYNLIVAVAVRALGHRAVLHHESYGYTARRDWRMSAITRILGPRALHVVLCERMRDEFQKAYPHAVRCIVVSNGFAVLGSARRRKPERRRVVLGHISNLSVDKGFDVVLDTFEASLAAGLDVSLAIAGPAQTATEREMLDATRERYAGRFAYAGPVYGADKEKFYDSIDVLVFPTRYRNEADPLVVLEALSHGVPVIAYSRGCIGERIPADGGCVVECEENFVARALPVIAGYASDSKELDHAQEAAVDRVHAIHAAAKEELNELMRCVASL